MQTSILHNLIYIVTRYFWFTQAVSKGVNADMSFFPRDQSTVLLFVEPNAQNLTTTFSQDFQYLHYVF